MCYDVGMNNEQLTTAEAAEMLGVSRQRVHQMARRVGIAPARKDTTHARRVFWMREDIRRLAERRQEYLRAMLDRATRPEEL